MEYVSQLAESTQNQQSAGTFVHHQMVLERLCLHPRQELVVDQVCVDVVTSQRDAYDGLRKCGRQGHPNCGAAIRRISMIPKP